MYSNLHRLKKSTDGSLSQLVATGDLHDLSPSNTGESVVYLMRILGSEKTKQKIKENI